MWQYFPHGLRYYPKRKKIPGWFVSQGLGCSGIERGCHPGVARFLCSVALGQGCSWLEVHSLPGKHAIARGRSNLLYLVYF